MSDYIYRKKKKKKRKEKFLSLTLKIAAEVYAVQIVVASPHVSLKLRQCFFSDVVTIPPSTNVRCPRDEDRDMVARYHELEHKVPRTKPKLLAART